MVRIPKNILPEVFEHLPAPLLPTTNNNIRQTRRHF